MCTTKNKNLKELIMIDTRKNTEHGFTLVELSIVLVIIGLIVGGILVGQDMINAARARSVVSQIEKYNSAVNVFQEKFNAIPGDYKDAVANISGALLDGDGNGAIASATGLAGIDVPPTVLAATSEYPLFWNHMSKANLVDGNFDGSITGVQPGTNFAQPKTGVGGILAYTDGSNLKRWFIGLTTTASAATGLNFGSAVTTGTGALKTTEAFSVDTKMDDGVADLGIVKAEDSPTVAATGVTGGTGCVQDAALDKYDLTQLGSNCRLNIRMN
jgi:prepilin-type N-terminal cleavage/methylation domain-containing protein